MHYNSLLQPRSPTQNFGVIHKGVPHLVQVSWPGERFHILQESVVIKLALRWYFGSTYGATCQLWSLLVMQWLKCSFSNSWTARPPG